MLIYYYGANCGLKYFLGSVVLVTRFGWTNIDTPVNAYPPRIQ